MRHSPLTRHVTRQGVSSANNRCALRMRQQQTPPRATTERQRPTSGYNRLKPAQTGQNRAEPAPGRPKRGHLCGCFAHPAVTWGGARGWATLCFVSPCGAWLWGRGLLPGAVQHQFQCWAPQETLLTHACACISLTSGVQLTLLTSLRCSGPACPFGVRSLCSVSSCWPSPMSLPVPFGCGCPALFGARGAWGAGTVLRGAVVLSALAVPLLFLSLQP